MEVTKVSCWGQAGRELNGPNLRVPAQSASLMKDAESSMGLLAGRRHANQLSWLLESIIRGSNSTRAESKVTKTSNYAARDAAAAAAYNNSRRSLWVTSRASSATRKRDRAAPWPNRLVNLSRPLASRPGVHVESVKNGRHSVGYLFRFALKHA